MGDCVRLLITIFKGLLIIISNCNSYLSKKQLESLGYSSLSIHLYNTFFNCIKKIFVNANEHIKDNI